MIYNCRCHRARQAVRDDDGSGAIKMRAACRAFYRTQYYIIARLPIGYGCTQAYGYQRPQKYFHLNPHHFLFDWFRKFS